MVTMVTKLANGVKQKGHLSTSWEYCLHSVALCGRVESERVNVKIGLMLAWPIENTGTLVTNPFTSSHQHNLHQCTRVHTPPHTKQTIVAF